MTLEVQGEAAPPGEGWVIHLPLEDPCPVYCSSAKVNWLELACLPTAAPITVVRFLTRVSLQACLRCPASFSFSFPTLVRGVLAGRTRYHELLVVELQSR